MTATKTRRPKTAAEEHTELLECRDQAYADLQAVKRRHAEHDEETRAMMARLTARTETHPEEFSGPNKDVKPGTEAAELSREILDRQRSPNPHQHDFDAARSGFHEADTQLEEWRARNVARRIAEAGTGRGVELIREGFELILLGVGEYGQDREEVRSIVLSTRGLTGQDVRDDPRVAEWGRLAAAALDSEIVEPGLNDRPAERVAARV